MPRKKISQEHLRPGIDRDFTVKEWCARRNISEARFWVMHRAGNGPDVIQVGKRGRISITAEADEAWAKRFSRKPKTAV